jgi:hypothetical protein
MRTRETTVVRLTKAEIYRLREAMLNVPQQSDDYEIWTKLQDAVEDTERAGKCQDLTRT